MKKFNLLLLGISFLATMGTLNAQSCSAGILIDASDPANVLFTDSSYTASPYDSTNSTLYLYDGNFNYLTSMDLRPSNTSQSYNFSTLGPGSYAYCYQVIDNNDNFCFDSICSYFVVECPDYDETFTWTANTNPLEFTFASNEGDFAGWSYDWDFGDGATGSGHTLNHTYVGTGPFVVSLTIEDTMGCSETYSDTVTTAASNCFASFTYYQDSTNSSQYWGYNLSTGNNITYSWNFGDGSTDTSQYPIHNYDNPGMYQICLTVTNGSCSDTFCDSITIFQKSAGYNLHILAPGETASVNELLEWKGLSVYPNPVQSSLLVKWEDQSRLISSAKLMDLNGRMVWEKEFSTSQQISIDMEKIQNGLYFVQLADQNGNTSALVRVIKQ